MIGTSVFIRDGFAEVEFLDRATKGELLGRLVAAAKAEHAPIRTDSGGPRRRYIVPEYIAEAAGFLELDAEADPFADIPTEIPEVVIPAAEIKAHGDAIVAEILADSEPKPAHVADPFNPEPPPRPGLKGATKSAWATYARAIGVPVTDAMTIAEIYAAVQSST